MGDILDRLVQLGIGEGISKTRDEMIKEDEIYNSDIRDMEELESRYEQLNLLKEEKRIIIKEFKKLGVEIRGGE